MNVQTICKDQNTNNNPCCQSINLIFPQGIGLITGIGSSVDTNSNSENPNKIFDATLFSAQEAQFGLYIRNKINKWNFSQIANPDSVSLIFETVNSKRQLSLYEDKITIDDGKIVSPIVTLTDLLTMGIIDEDENPIPVGIDLNKYATVDALNESKTYIDEQIANIKIDNIDLNSYATTEFVNEQIALTANVRQGEIERINSYLALLENENKSLQTQVSDLEKQVKTMQQQIDDILTQLNP